ncbi:MAG: RidA family protein [Sphingomonadaceae bacterium]
MKGFALAALLALAMSAATAAAAGAATPEERLAAAGLRLPEANRPIGLYAPAVRSGNLLFLSGHGECGTLTKGKVGASLSLEEGRASAQRVALCLLASAKAEIGELSRVSRVVKVTGFVNAAPDFVQHPQVVNGFSEVLVTAFGEEAGRAARSSVGMSGLPGDMAVEVEAIFELAEQGR